MADAALYILAWPRDRVETALSQVSKELKCLWGEEPKLSLQAQARLAEAGFTVVGIFAALDDNEAAVRAFVLGDMGFKPDTELIAKGTVTRVIAAWKDASKRGEKRTAAEAEQRAGDLPRTLPNKQKKHLELVRAHYQIHKEFVEKDVPYAGCVEAKLEQLESDEFVAPQLTEVACKEEGVKGRAHYPATHGCGHDCAEQVRHSKSATTGQH